MAIESRAEIRFETDAFDLAVLDGYCAATGKSRTDIIRRLLRDWSSEKHREATLIMRVAGDNPNHSESHRNG